MGCSSSDQADTGSQDLLQQHYDLTLSSVSPLCEGSKGLIAVLIAVGALLGNSRGEGWGALPEAGAWPEAWPQDGCLARWGLLRSSPHEDKVSLSLHVLPTVLSRS